MRNADPDFVQQLCTARRAHRLPVRASALAQEFVHDLLGLLFPHFATETRCTPEQVAEDYRRTLERVDRFVVVHPAGAEEPGEVAARFGQRLPALYENLMEDARAIYEADPAARSVDEVIMAYPGFFAMACYRAAHELQDLGVDLLPRLITEVAHRETGIDIHPGARIGRAFSIDHGTGIVIGETSVIGDRVRLYQGVTLGALSVRKHASVTKRHPTIENDVVLYANATILGGETLVGAGSIIGGNVWLTHSVPPGSIVTEVANIEKKLADAGGAGPAGP